jgi:hypothetical protein
MHTVHLCYMIFPSLSVAIIMTSHRLKASLFPCESGIFVIISVVWALFWNLVLTVRWSVPCNFSKCWSDVLCTETSSCCWSINAGQPHHSDQTSTPLTKNQFGRSSGGYLLPELEPQVALTSNLSWEFFQMPGPRIMYLFLHCIGSLILATIVIIILLSSTSPCYCTKFICLSSEDPVLQLPEIRV